MKLEFGYGSGTQTVEVPDANVKAVMLSYFDLKRGELF